MRRQKYGNIPTASRHTLGASGKPRMFQSKLEASREPTLIALQNVGAISDLRYQVPYDLDVYSTPDVEALLKHLNDSMRVSPMSAVGRLIGNVEVSHQRIARYVADFVYEQDGKTVVEDTKGYATDVYRIKKRLMMAANNIEIVEPNTRGVQQRARGAGVKGRGTGSRFKGGR